MKPADLKARRDWLVWALALSRAQRRRRGIRAEKLRLIYELEVVDRMLASQDTSTPPDLWAGNG